MRGRQNKLLQVIEATEKLEQSRHTAVAVVYSFPEDTLVASLFSRVTIKGTRRLGQYQALPMPRPALLMLPSVDARRANLRRLGSELRAHPRPRHNAGPAGVCCKEADRLGLRALRSTGPAEALGSNPHRRQPPAPATVAAAALITAKGGGTRGRKMVVPLYGAYNANCGTAVEARAGSRRWR